MSLSHSYLGNVMLRSEALSISNMPVVNNTSLNQFRKPSLWSFTLLHPALAFRKAKSDNCQKKRQAPKNTKISASIEMIMSCANCSSQADARNCYSCFKSTAPFLQIGPVWAFLILASSGNVIPTVLRMVLDYWVHPRHLVAEASWFHH